MHEPEITVASDLEEIEVFIHTNIPNYFQAKPPGINVSN